MPIRDHEPIPIVKFNGLFQRGKQDSCPLDHFTDCLNVKFTQDEVDTRDGFASLITFATPIVRGYIFKVFGQADRILFLDNTGKIWDSTNLGAPILNIPTMTDFAFTPISGRAYLSPTNGSTGLAGEFIYVYQGSGTARKIAGAAPVAASLQATNSASVGNVEAGFHIFAIAYEFDTGFISAPGPAIFATVTATGGLSVNLTGIPTGGTGVSFVRILATKIIQNYNGNQNGYELFFVPDGRIANGNSTATVSFFDVDLLTAGSASYLFDLFSEVSATLWLDSYGSRLIGGGENANPSVVRVSEAGQPEAINELTGLLVVDPANTSSPVTNGSALRGQYYLTKKTRTYGTNDNGGDPSTWQVLPVDEGIGSFQHCIATVLDSGGNNIDKLFIAGNSGLMLFNGTYLSKDLTWKIRDLWARINAVYFNKVQIAHDPISKNIYVTVPLDSATEPTHLLVADYTDCDIDLSEWWNLIKWSVWTIGGSVKPTTIFIEEISSVPNNLLFGSSSNNIYKQVIGQTTDFSNSIPNPFVQTALVPGGEDAGLMHFAGIQVRITGSGLLTPTLYSFESATSQVGPNITLGSTGEPWALINFTALKAMLKLSLNSSGDNFKLNRIRIYVKEIFKQLPY